MADVTAKIGRKKFKMDVTSSHGNSLIADEPRHLGGQDLGFSPFELLASSLGTCTAATMRMYSDRKKWDMEEVIVRVSVERDDKADKAFFVRHIEMKGNLDKDQCARLLEIANKCPIHRTLEGTIEIETIAN